MKPLDPRQRSNVIPQGRKDEEGRARCRWCDGVVPKGRRSWCSQECVDDALIRTQPNYARQKVGERDNGVCANCGRDTREIKNTLRRLGTIARDGIQGYSRTRERASKRYQIEPNRLWTICNAGTTSFEKIEYDAKIAAREAEFGVSRYPVARFNDRVLDVTPEEQRVRVLHRRMKSLFAARLKRLSAELAREGFDGIGRFGHVNRSLWDADHIIPVVKGGGGCGLENYRTLCQPCHKDETAALAAARAAERKAAKLAEKNQISPELPFE